MNTFEVTEYIHDDSQPEPELREYKVQVEYYKDSNGGLWEVLTEDEEGMSWMHGDSGRDWKATREQLNTMEKIVKTEIYWD